METPTKKVLHAATCICLRKRIPAPTVIRAKDALEMGGECPQWFPKDIHFTNEFEVLLGQSEVVNWMRSKQPGPLIPMRYGGEFRFPGGTLDEGETPEMAAKRELREEFLLDVDPVIKPFIVLQTREVKGVSHIMHNFICCCDDNSWLRGDIENEINEKLSKKRRAFEELTDWTKPTEDLSPEVREVKWLLQSEAVKLCLPSGAACYIPVNDFQATEYARMGIKKRDPMEITMDVLLAMTGDFDENIFPYRLDVGKL